MKLWPSTNGQLVATLVAVGAAMAGVAATVVLLAPSTSTPDTTVASAGPLHAHYEQIGSENVAICDASVVTTSDDGRDGVAGAVNIAGPAVVDVTVIGNGRKRHGTQQVTRNDDQVTFDFPLTAPVESITVTARAGASIGSCKLVPLSHAINRSNTLSGWVG